MSNNDFLEDIRKDNIDYHGKMKSITFIVEQGAKEKKIFKWIFESDDIDSTSLFLTSKVRLFIVEPLRCQKIQ